VERVDRWGIIIRLTSIHRHKANLLKQILNEGKKQNIPIKTGVLKANQRAQKFYKVHGFKQTGETTTHYLMQVAF
jgi:predicted GNAT family N-acyltransferase